MDRNNLILYSFDTKKNYKIFNLKMQIEKRKWKNIVRRFEGNIHRKNIIFPD